MIQFSSEEQRVREGARVTLECVARGNPAPRVSIVKYEHLDVPSTPITMPQMSLGFEVGWSYQVTDSFTKISLKFLPIYNRTCAGLYLVYINMYVNIN